MKNPVYSNYDIEMNFVVNANKFHTGKLVISPLYDSYQAEILANDYRMALTRPHLILDLATNVSGKLCIPFVYHRTFVRNFLHKGSNVGVRAAKSVSVYCCILSPLTTGADGPKNVEIRCTYKFVKANFSGMSYRVPVAQMKNIIGTVANVGIGSLRTVLENAEGMLTQFGRSLNQDKPTDIVKIVQTVPRPRLNFRTGTGLSDATVLKLNPGALTTFLDCHNEINAPRTTLELARIWGYRSSFVWNDKHNEGDIIFSQQVDPTCRTEVNQGSLKYDFVPTPVEYVSNMYALWGGTMEYRLDFFSNSFYTGSVLISAEFNRPSTNENISACESYSTYTKMFQLGDQIPYIYDTVYRRNGNGAYNMYWEVEESLEVAGKADKARDQQVFVQQLNRTYIKVRVINVLRPVKTVSPELNVIVYQRAGKSFRVKGLCQSGAANALVTNEFGNFPRDYPFVQATKQLTVQGDVNKTLIATTSVGVKEKKKQENSIPKARAQVETGEKENEDPTDNFSGGDKFDYIQNCDDETNILTIMRRPIYLLHGTIPVYSVAKMDAAYYIPVQPPSRVMTSLDWTYDGPNKIYTYRANGDYNWKLQTNPGVCLNNLFRFWRGSLRYTFIFYAQKMHYPIYISYLPHTGERIVGPKTTLTATTASGDTNKFPLVPVFSSGLVTEIVIPTINQTVTVEVPYVTENNWTLMFDENVTRNYSWRDKGDTNSGHLLISSLQEYQFDCWVSAGDDYTVSNFFGIPPCHVSGNTQCVTEEFPKAQMEEDFPRDNLQTRVCQVVKKNKAKIGLAVGAAVASTVPVVGSALVAGVGALRVDSAMGKFENTCESITAEVADVSGIVKEVLTKVNNLLPSFSGDFTTVLWDFLLDVINVGMNQNWTALSVMLVRRFSKIGAYRTMDFALLSSTCNRISKFFRSLIVPVGVVHAQIETQTLNVSLVAGLLASLLGLLVNVSLTEYDITVVNLAKGFIKKVTFHLLIIK